MHTQLLSCRTMCWGHVLYSKRAESSDLHTRTIACTHDNTTYTHQCLDAPKHTLSTHVAERLCCGVQQHLKWHLQQKRGHATLHLSNNTNSMASPWLVGPPAGKQQHNMSHHHTTHQERRSFKEIISTGSACRQQGIWITHQLKGSALPDLTVCTARQHSITSTLSMHTHTGWHVRSTLLSTR